VYCMATPTIAGAKEMLAYLGAKPISEGHGLQKVILTDLREEAVVYINGTPFVLRELNKPVDTLKHVGITGSVVRHSSNMQFDSSNSIFDLLTCEHCAGRTHGGTAKGGYYIGDQKMWWSNAFTP